MYKPVRFTKLVLIFLSAAVSLATLARVAFADLETGVLPYTLETSDGLYLFVMLADSPSQLPASDPLAKYSSSGLYRNDQSTAPLWTVDWSAYVILPRDGEHLIRRGGWPRAAVGCHEEALTFFSNGNALKTYTICDLTDFSWFLPHSSSHYDWVKPLPETAQPNSSPLHVFGGKAVEMMANNMLLNERDSTLTLETLEGSRFVFDIRTGEIISSRRPARTAFIIVCCLLFALYVAYLALRARAPRKPRNWVVTLVGYGTGVALIGLVAMNLENVRLRGEGMTVPMTALWRGVVYLPVSLAQSCGLSVVAPWSWVAATIVLWSSLLIFAIGLNHMAKAAVRFVLSQSGRPGSGL